MMTSVIFRTQNDESFWALLNGIFFNLSGKGRSVHLEENDRLGVENEAYEVRRNGKELYLALIK